ncbi:uncharacterized protein LOC118350911 isoform X5 [Canis lupus dingo]|uniref:uncharacterized protein LOC118350911 isoform X5 n=1 Tax=Canis lupus dingo TaxID=286419 RepID=UPI0020C1E0A8|nr:uncharacterized protein LOC118350911 isoform X5 [Canis lupus dingo]
MSLGSGGGLCLPHYVPSPRQVTDSYDDEQGRSNTDKCSNAAAETKQSKPQGWQSQRQSALRTQEHPGLRAGQGTSLGSKCTRHSGAGTWTPSSIIPEQLTIESQIGVLVECSMTLGVHKWAGISIFPYIFIGRGAGQSSILSPPFSVLIYQPQDTDLHGQHQKPFTFFLQGQWMPSPIPGMSMKATC